MPKWVPFTYEEALTLNFICVAYDFAALSVFVYVQFNNMGKIEVPIGITKLQKEILNLQQEKEILKGDYERGSEQFRDVEEQLCMLKKQKSGL